MHSLPVCGWQIPISIQSYHLELLDALFKHDEISKLHFELNFVVLERSCFSRDIYLILFKVFVYHLNVILIFFVIFD